MVSVGFSSVVWTVVLLMTCHVVSIAGSKHNPGDIDGPCMGCRLFNMHHRQHPEKKQDTVFCHYPCQCPIKVIDCKRENRSEIKDGCGCCFMCAKQLNEPCSVRDKCDSAKELYCDRKDDKSIGICKGTHKKNPCFVNGVTFQDGETFALECSQVCTCQNGFYGCSSRCPHELVKPSESTCHDPKLIKVKNECCREWMCQRLEYNGTSARRGLRSQSLIRRDLLSRMTTSAPPTTTLAVPQAERGVVMGPCSQKSSPDWTPCSKSCDTGVSMRTIVDPVTCAVAKELQLCMLRPCQEKFEREQCSATVKVESPRRIFYEDCVSVKTYRLKFCDTCRKRKCCFPRRTRQRTLEFQCSHGKRENFTFMWIKKCRCAKKCYGKLESRSKRRRERERSKKRRERERGKKRRARERNKKRRERERDKKRKAKKRNDKRGKRRKSRT